MAHITVVGSGVVGQATGKGFLRRGHELTFVDVNERTLSALRDDGYSTECPQSMDLTGQNFVFVCVSTPSVSGRIVLTSLEEAACAIGKELGRALEKSHRLYPIIAVRSTVPPGTTEEIVIPILERCSGGKSGNDFGVAVNPEFLRENQAEKDFSNPWVTVIGANEDRTWEALAKLYVPFGSRIHRLPIREVEFQKYVHNLFNAAKISFFNEMRRVAYALGLDPERIFELVAQSAEGIWHPAYGMRNLGPFGGSCLPKDTQAFLSFTRDKGIKVPLLSAVIAVNEAMKKEAFHG